MITLAHVKFTNDLFLARENNTVVFLLEPLHGVLLGEPVRKTNLALLPAAMRHVEAGPAQHDVEVQSVDTNRRVVLDTQVNVFLDSETKVTTRYKN